MNDPSQMMNRGFGIWPPRPLAVDDPMAYQNPNPNARPPFASSAGGWKGRKATEKRNKAAAAMASGALRTAALGGAGGYKPPTLNELQFQNRLKARRFYPKKKFARFAPYAPRNTTSFIIRAKKSGGIASLVSPCPVTPAILPTPKFSPTSEVLVDTAKEEWGVDGYGSMKGLIRLRSPTRMDTAPAAAAADWGNDDDDNEAEYGSSDSDVEEHLEVERRLDHDLSRFEMVYPGGAGEDHLLENRIDDQDSQIERLEEENLTMKERLFLMEREMGDMQRRLQMLEMQFHASEENNSNNNNNNNNNINSKNINMEDMNESSNGNETSETNKGGDLCSGDDEESNRDLMHGSGVPLLPESGHT